MIYLSEEIEKSELKKKEISIKPVRERAGFHVFLGLLLAASIVLVMILKFFIQNEAMFLVNFDINEFKTWLIQQFASVGTVMIGVSIAIQSYTHWLTLNPLKSAVSNRVSRNTIVSLVTAFLGTLLCLVG